MQTQEGQHQLYLKTRAKQQNMHNGHSSVLVYHNIKTYHKPASIQAGTTSQGEQVLEQTHEHKS